MRHAGIQGLAAGIDPTASWLMYRYPAQAPIIAVCGETSGHPLNTGCLARRVGRGLARARGGSL